METTNNGNTGSRFVFDSESVENARIKVIGVGGGGGNAINTMITNGLNNVEYIALNTDSQALKKSQADRVVQVGASLTSGLGAGARPEVGREAVEENRHEIEEAIEGSDMIFVTAGMGGGTGTGGAPVVAGIAKRKGILTVGVVTTPFDFEGKPRMRYALEGIKELKKNCDTLIVIPNQRLFEVSEENTTLMQAFKMADDVLLNATRGICDLILMPGIVNVDFADVRTTMLDGGAAIMGSASASGPDRAEIATRQAINSPLLDGLSIRGSRNVLLNISSSSELKMNEINLATKIIQDEVGEDAEIIWGTVLDEEYGEELRVTVIATGFELNSGDGKTGLVPIKKPDNGPVSGSSGAAAMPPAAAQSGEKRRSVLPNLPGMRPPVPAPHTAQRPPLTRFKTQDDKPAESIQYKGEENLKNLDKPAFTRRERIIRKLSDQGVSRDDDQRTDEDAGSGSSSRFNIKKASGDRDQPPFLRNLMD